MNLIRPLRSLSLSTVFFAAALAAPTLAQEHGELGRMWTFENPPLAYLEDEYGFKPDQVWLDKVRMASLRFGEGCSASFVSPKGLIMTNHHCVRGNIADVQGGNDWVRDGFVSASLEDEVKIPGLTVQQLIEMRDVTTAMNEGIGEGADDAAVNAAREANKERIVAAATQELEDGHEAEVVELFQGAQYQLYIYRIYSDIRLVVAPHLQAAHFGGDPDNFTYPRFGIDFAFCRAYHNDQPADTSGNYFKWSEMGAQKGEVVFVTGNPGSTDRLMTKAQFEYVRDAKNAILLEMLDDRIDIVKPFMERSAEFEKRVRTTMLSWQNGQKAIRGALKALNDPEFMARKDRAERAFKQRVMSDPALAAEYGELWDEIAEVAAAQTALEPATHFHNTGSAAPADKALAVIRAIEARAAGSDDAEQLTQIAQRMPAQLNPIMQGLAVNHIERAQKWLPANDPYLRILLDGRTPQEALAWLMESEIGNPRFVESLFAGGMEAVQASDDPAVRLARFVAARQEATANAAEDLAKRASVLGSKLGLALFAAYGDKISPDATFTLRLSDGVVQGYAYNGTIAPWRTTFYGMYGRNVEFGDVYPFDLPELWKEREGQIDMDTSVNFVCTVDSTGGNSGSPVVNREREIVGLLFDGNIESLSNDYSFDDRTARSVCVHAAAILESLRKVYDAPRIAEELVGSK